jgi:hypothetical protein
MNYQKKYYQNNKSKVLEYKKKCYKQKIEKINLLKKIKIIGLKISTSNKLIKTFFDSKRLEIYINETQKVNIELDIEELKKIGLDKVKGCLGVLDKDSSQLQCENAADEDLLEYINDDCYILQMYIYIKDFKKN